MIFDVKPIGNWKGVNRLLKDYGDRVENLERIVTKRLAEIFLEILKKYIPNDMDEYLDSLRVVELVGGMEKNDFAFAVVADPEKMEASSLDPDTTVVYIVNMGQKISLLATLVIAHSPWTLDQMPMGFNPNSVDIIYREVSKSEVNRLRAVNKRVLMEKEGEFARAGSRRKSKKDLSEMKAAPDLVFKAIRMEFGIQEKRRPHWSKSLKEVWKEFEKEIKSDKLFERYLTDYSFTGYKGKGKRLGIMKNSFFQKKFGAFAKKIQKV